MAIKQKTHRDCENPACGKKFKKYKTTDKYCSGKCEIEHKGKPEVKPRARIKPVSEKRTVENLQYTADRILFLGKNKVCVIKGPTCTGAATTIEHSAGRIGFYDDWARDNKISLFLDQRFWLPACCNCNLELENNPELSKQFQLSKIHGGKKE